MAPIDPAQSWSGLRCLWGWVKRIIAVVMLGLVGGMVGFTIGGVATVFVYGIGAYLGGPIGLALGATTGAKIPVRDAVIVFFACLSALIGVSQYGIAQGWNGFVAFIAACIASSVMAPVALVCTRAQW